MRKMHVATCKHTTSTNFVSPLKPKPRTGGFQMYIFKVLVAISTSLVISSVQAHDHPADHVKHNMVVYGSPAETYASHIVYKVPHNYQVILKIRFDLQTQEIYRQARAQ